jgi:response regulator RpfG family c-di-GMP phosphodiesterase
VLRVFSSLCLFLSLCISCTGYRGEILPPQAIEGVLDLKDWDIGAQKPLSLRGEWEFYGDSLFAPEDFSRPNPPAMSGYIPVPGVWNGRLMNGKKLAGSGFATYRLRIDLGNNDNSLSFKPGAILTAYRFYVNGELLGGRGSVGDSRKDSVPMLLADTIEYRGKADTLEVILQVSNFHHRQGGLWDKIVLGNTAAIYREDRTTRDMDFFILGSLLVMGIFYLSMFLSRKSDSSYLYFSLFCFTIALRMSLQSGVGYLNQIFPHLGWEAINKAEYITIYISLPFFMLFIISFFKDRFLLFLYKAVFVISAVFTVFTLATTTILHSWLIPPYQAVLLSVGLYILFLIVKNSLNKDVFARILLFAFLFLFATVINDILYSNGYIKSVFLISYGLLLFIMFQAHILTVRFIDVFYSVDRQKRQLAKTNTEYREEIEARIETENSLKASNENLLLAKSAIILGLAKIAEYRDSDTGFHLARIQEYNRILALQLTKHPDYADYISVEYINDLYESSILHDIGKVGVSDSILLKPGKLTAEEFEMIKKHPTIGGDTIKSIEKNIHAQTFLTLGREIAYMHHEKWDGSGYPNGTKGLDIPLSARITALTDVYDALTTRRCYKEAFSHETAVEIITADRGKHFDPVIVDAFLAVHEEFSFMRSTLQDSASDPA